MLIDWPIQQQTDAIDPNIVYLLCGEGFSLPTIMSSTGGGPSIDSSNISL